MSSPSSPSSSDPAPSLSSSSSPKSSRAGPTTGRRLKTAKDFVEEEAASSSDGNDTPRGNDLFAEEDPHQEAPDSDDELMNEVEQPTAERGTASPPPEPSAPSPVDNKASRQNAHPHHRPARMMTIQPAFCPGANTPQGVEATESNNGINKILLCWNAHGVVTRQMLTPADVEVPEDEVPESALEVMYTIPGAPPQGNRIKDSVYGWSMASLSDKGVVFGAPCLAITPPDEDAYDEDDFVTDAKQGGESSTNVARVQFRPAASYRPGISNSSPREWIATVPLGEQLICVGIGRDFVTGMTFCNKAGSRIRIWSLNAGLPTNVISIGCSSSRPVSMVASAASGLMLWAVADYGGDATKIRYTLAQTARGGSRVGVLSEGPLPVSGGHHDAGQGPTLTWIGMTTESMPLSMDSVGIIRALLPTGVFAFWSSTDLKWAPVYDCVAELQRENEGFWAVGGAGLNLHICRTRYEDAYEPRGFSLPRVLPSVTWRIRLSSSKTSDKTKLGDRLEAESAFAERTLATWKQFCQDRGINSGEEPSEIKKATVALDKKLVMKFRDLVQSKQLEAAYDTSILALQIPATPRFMAKMALKLGQPLLAARIEEDMASVVIPSMPTGNVAQPVMAKPTPERQNRAIPPPSTAPPRSAFQAVENIPSRRSTGAEMMAETKAQEASKNAPIRGNPFANRKRRQNDDVDHTNAAKVLRADGQ